MTSTRRRRLAAARRANSVQPELALDRAELRRLDQARVSDRHRMEQAVQLARPEIEEFLQLGEMRVQVVLLPDVILQEAGMVGHAVENVGRRQAKPFGLTAEIGAGHAVSPKAQPGDDLTANARLQPLFRKKHAAPAC